MTSAELDKELATNANLRTQRDTEQYASAPIVPMKESS
jgi:hypothetical protein